MLLPLLALAALPPALLFLRRWPRAMVALAVLGCALPFLLPVDQPLWRAAAATLAGLLVVKCLQYAAGHERPEGALDTLLFLIIPAVAHWQQPRTPDPARAWRSLRIGALQLGFALLLVDLLQRFAPTSPWQLLLVEFGIYCSLAGVFNLAVVALAWRGVAFTDPFNHPLAARTPGEFWGRRWNTWVNHLLYRYVFVPVGGRSHPARATAAAFVISAVLHEAIIFAATLRVSGWMGAFFLVQGALVLVTSHPRVRAWSRANPRASWVLTLTLMAITGVLFVRGAAGIEPSGSWARCCAGGS